MARRQKPQFEVQNDNPELKKFYKSYGYKKHLKDQVKAIKEKIAQFQDSTLEDCKERTQDFKRRLVKGTSLDDLVPEAFANVYRVTQLLKDDHENDWFMLPYEVQLIAAVALSKGSVAEMKTGEGKTLVATMPLYLNALVPDEASLAEYEQSVKAKESQLDDLVKHELDSAKKAGKGFFARRKLKKQLRRKAVQELEDFKDARADLVENGGAHLVTVNDYLARRDAEWMAPVYEALGLTVGYNLSEEAYKQLDPELIALKAQHDAAEKEFVKSLETHKAFTNLSFVEKLSESAEQLPYGDIQENSNLIDNMVAMAMSLDYLQENNVLTRDLSHQGLVKQSIAAFQNTMQMLQVLPEEAQDKRRDVVDNLTNVLKTNAKLLSSSIEDKYGSKISLYKSREEDGSNEAQINSRFQHMKELESIYFNRVLEKTLEEKQEAYGSDIMYTTSHELMFDYLRDNSAKALERMVQRRFNYVLVDEVDSGLIDEANVPAILSGVDERNQLDGEAAELEQILRVSADRLAQGIIRRQEQIVEDYKQTLKDERKNLYERLGVETKYDKIKNAQQQIASLMQTEMDDKVRQGEIRVLVKQVETLKAQVRSDLSEGEKLYNSKLERFLKESPELYYKEDKVQNSCPLTEKGLELFEGLIKGVYWQKKKEDGSLEEERLVPEDAQPGYLWSDPENIQAISMLDFFKSAMQVHLFHHKGEDYIEHVDERGNKKILLMSKEGRVKAQSKYKGGIHQAIEVKEGVEVEPPGITFGQISHAYFFKKYNKIAGMSGTAVDSKEEFAKVYGLGVVDVPTNRPMIRQDNRDKVFLSKGNGILKQYQQFKKSEAPLEAWVGHLIEDRNYPKDFVEYLCGRFEEIEALIGYLHAAQAEGKEYLEGNSTAERSDNLKKLLLQFGVTGKYNAIIRDIYEKQQKGQPVLAVAPTEKDAGEIHDILGALGIEHEFLIGSKVFKDLEYEDRVVVKAGQVGAVTVSTGMAGRGTDIKLGEGVKELGGLYVLGIERNPIRRIDNQLIGRAGRQGDPGESQFYISFGDRFFSSSKEGEGFITSENFARVIAFNRAQFTNAAMKQVSSDIKNPYRREEHAKQDELLVFDDYGSLFTRIAKFLHLPTNSSTVAKVVNQVQDALKQNEVKARKYKSDLDGAFDKQRSAFYQDRRDILEADSMHDGIEYMLSKVLEEVFPDTYDSSHRPMEEKVAELSDILGIAIRWEEAAQYTDCEAREFLQQELMDKYLQMEAAVSELGVPFSHDDAVRMTALMDADQAWFNYLEDLELVEYAIGNGTIPPSYGLEIDNLGLSQRDPVAMYGKISSMHYRAVMKKLRNKIVGTALGPDFEKSFTEVDVEELPEALRESKTLTLS